MAEGKKAFIVYTDWIKYTDLMTIEQKGIWIDWCLKYCNDLNPDFPNDPMAKMLCVMCQDILKRDLKKYEEKKERFLKIGKQYQNNDIGNEKTKIPNTEKNTKPKSECVNSNKLIVNSNKLIVDDNSSNNIDGEEEQIENLKQLIHSIEGMFNRCLTNAETITIQEFSKTMTNESIIRDLKTYSDKTNPIAYMKKALENAKIQEQVKPKQEEQEQKTYEINCWLDAFNIYYDEEAPQYIRDKAKKYMEDNKRGN